jgi:hypothetical protein
MPNGRPSIEEQYTSGDDVLNFVVYQSTTGPGEDEVLQHKLAGVEFAHITLHPDGSVNVREKRNKAFLVLFVKTELHGFTPAPSSRLKAFLARVTPKL